MVETKRNVDLTNSLDNILETSKELFGSEARLLRENSAEKNYVFILSNKITKDYAAEKCKEYMYNQENKVKYVEVDGNSILIKYANKAEIEFRLT